MTATGRFKSSRRTGSPVILVVVIVVLFGAVAWLTRNPDTPLLDRVVDLPWLGKIAEGFRRAYLPPEVTQPESASSPPSQGVVPQVVIQVPEAQDLDARPTVWVPADSTIRARPSETSEILSVTESLGNLSRLQQQGDWYQVRIPGQGRRPTLGWVYLEAYSEPSREILDQPEPVLPLSAVPPDPGAVDRARSLMVSGGRELDCGPYELITDLTVAPVLEACGPLAQNLESVYRQRYGLQAVSDPAEIVLLFRAAESYRVFRDHEGVRYSSNLAHASPARGYLALFVGQRSDLAVLATLVHEWTHLLNRRSLGPALPDWLGEGMADDMAESQIGVDGSIVVGKLGGEVFRQGGAVVRRGGIASALLLQKALDAGRLTPLKELMEMESATFHTLQASLRYAESSFWIRYLLSDFALPAAGFREFLGEIAAGAPIQDQRLLAHLDSTWDELDIGFRTWLRLQRLEERGELPVTQRGEN